MIVVAAMGIDALEANRRTQIGSAIVLGVGALVLALDTLPLSLIQDFRPERGEHVLRIVLLAIAAAVLLTRPALRVSVAVVVMLAVAGVPWSAWIRNNAQYVTTNDLDKVRYALVVRDATDPHAVVALATAGTMPYYYDRATIDLLGKSDRRVAGEHPRLKPFYPGHNKWDYAYSICTLRPDLVTELWAATDADRALITGCGYLRVRGHDVYVRADTGLVDRLKLERGIGVLERESPHDF